MLVPQTKEPVIDNLTIYSILPQLNTLDKVQSQASFNLTTYHCCYSGWLAMNIDPELLKILACPACKTPVSLVADDTGLKCNQCHRIYPIKDDIPVMLIDEATIEP